MITTVFKEFKFSAAHHLCIPGHKCSTMHGHNYRVTVECSGPADANGMVVDFHEMKRRIDPIIARLDHKCLNDVILSGTTSELIAEWIASEVSAVLPSVHRVTLWETDTCGATVLV